MRTLRILFMGTPDFAVTTLHTILANQFTVVGVVTAPDKPAGRGRKLKSSAVKEYAISKELPVLQPINLKAPEFIAQLEELKPNLSIVVAFRMLPKLVWSMPEYGTFNLHASLLPEYRGAAPINWAVINGEEKTGITTFFIDDKIDTGHIILQKEVAIGPKDTAGVVHDILMNEGAQLVIDTLHTIKDNTVTTIPQSDTKPSKTAYKLHRDNTKIDWTANVQTIYNFIRGLSPYPTAWTTLYNGAQELFIKIHEATAVVESHEFEIGTVITENRAIKIAVQEGYIIPKKIQLPGKKAMDVKSLLNGYVFSENAKVS